MSQFQRSHDEIAQELEEKERLLQDKEVQAQVYKEEAESANARVCNYPGKCVRRYCVIVAHSCYKWRCV